MRQAVLEFAEFRNIDLVHSRLPNDQAHVVFTNCGAALRHVIELLVSRSDDGSRRLSEYLKAKLKWIPSGASLGVLHLGELGKVGDAAAVAAMLRSMEAWIVIGSRGGEGPAGSPERTLAKRRSQ